MIDLGEEKENNGLEKREGCGMVVRRGMRERCLVWVVEGWRRLKADDSSPRS